MKVMNDKIFMNDKKVMKVIKVIKVMNDKIFMKSYESYE
jgi:hypothetical protein